MACPRPSWYLDPVVAAQKQAVHLDLVARWMRDTARRASENRSVRRGQRRRSTALRVERPVRDGVGPRYQHFNCPASPKQVPRGLAASCSRPPMFALCRFGRLGRPDHFELDARSFQQPRGFHPRARRAGAHPAAGRMPDRHRGQCAESALLAAAMAELGGAVSPGLLADARHAGTDVAGCRPDHRPAQRN